MAAARGKSMYVKVASKGYVFLMSLPCSPSDLIFFCALGHSWFISKFIVFPSSPVENRCNTASNLFWNLLFQVKPEHKYSGTLYWSLFCGGRWMNMGWDSSSVKQYPTDWEVNSPVLPAFSTSETDIFKYLSVVRTVHLSREVLLCILELENDCERHLPWQLHEVGSGPWTWYVFGPLCVEPAELKHWRILGSYDPTI